jgi:hypothetical protein
MPSSRKKKSPVGDGAFLSGEHSLGGVRFDNFVIGQSFQELPFQELPFQELPFQELPFQELPFQGLVRLGRKRDAHCSGAAAEFLRAEIL